jgi:hypothetical protein
MRHRRLTLALLAACLAPSAGAQSASFATQERDLAAIDIASTNLVVSRLGTLCLALVGRPETPQAFVADWQQRNVRYVSASAKYLDQRVAQAATEGRREQALGEIRAVVENNAEAALRQLLEGRKEDGCMRAITLSDTGALDISPKLPDYDQIEALARWAGQ